MPPVRLPTKMLQDRGSKDVKYRRRNEPKPQRGIPRKPSWLRKDAVKFWNAMAKQLDELGVLAISHGDMLADLANARAQIIELEKIIKRDGQFFTSSEGKFLVHPAVVQCNVMRRNVYKLLREFGLSPSSQAGVQTLPKMKGDVVDGKGMFNIK